MQMEGVIGCIAPGASADILIIDGDPLNNISLLAEDGRRVSTIVRDGKIVKNELH